MYSSFLFRYYSYHDTSFIFFRGRHSSPTFSATPAQRLLILYQAVDSHRLEITLGGETNDNRWKVGGDFTVDVHKFPYETGHVMHEYKRQCVAVYCCASK